MRGVFLLIIGCLAVSAKLSASEEPDTCRHDEKSFRCVEYIRNYDGDTITFNIPKSHPLFGSMISVRVRGIDAAEVRTKDPCEKQASRAGKALVASALKSAKQIDLVNVARDKYFRILADVHADGESIGELLLKKRLAVAYDGGTKSQVNWCEMIAVSEPSKID